MRSDAEKVKVIYLYQMNSKSHVYIYQGVRENPILKVGEILKIIAMKNSNTDVMYDTLLLTAKTLVKVF